MHLGASGGKRPDTRFGASEADYLMIRVNEFLNDGRTDEACSTSNENAHIKVPPLRAFF